MQKLINYIKGYIDLSKQLEEDLGIYFKIANYAKGDIILEAGRKCQYLYFLNKGTIRTFYYQDSRDVTSWIYPQGNFITSWYSFLGDRAAFENIQATSVCEMLYINKADLDALYEKYPEMERFGRKMMEDYLVFFDEINHGFMFFTAKERYDRILELFPDIIKVGNLGHIASILGISQETLSRIRKMK